MENDQARFFGERVAAAYDATSRRSTTASVRHVDDAVAFLERTAAGGPALELAIGTGRVALPLAARGISVDGIDISPAMVAKLREKPGGAELDVTVGDVAAFDLGRTYRLVFIVANSLTNLAAQDRQVQCFESVARHLTDDGMFVIESFIPEPDWLRDGQYVRVEAVTEDAVFLDVCRIDVVEQRLDESHVVLSEAGVQLRPVLTRFVWPSELDLMAKVAGLERRERWAGWRGEPFTGESGSFVTVYAHAT